MTGKRKSLSGKPNESAEAPSKRVKTESSTQSLKSSTPQPSQLKQADKKLIAWLDKKDLTNAPLFTVDYPSKKVKGGRSRTEELSLDGRKYSTVEFSVKPQARWDQLNKFRRCTVGEDTMKPGMCILVKAPDDETVGPDDDRLDNTLSMWKAQLHEVRAADENHVYLRVTWLYRPRDIVNGSKPYHGRYELVPTNEMCVIDAMSVNGPVTVKHWDDYADDEIPEPEKYYWRQTYDIVSQTYSQIRTICKCQQPYNADELILQCDHCDNWLHVRCIVEEAVQSAERHPVADVQRDASPETNGTQSEDVTKTEQNGAASVDKVDEEDQEQPHGLVEAAVHVRDPGDGEDSQRSRIVLIDKRSGKLVEREEEVKCLLCSKTIV